MKIAIDVQSLISLNRTGIGYVAQNVVEGLLGADGCEVYLYYFAAGKSAGELALVDEYEKRGAHLAPCRWLHHRVYELLTTLLPIPYRWFFHADVDVTHIQNNYTPPFVKGRTVTTVHDVLPKTHPEWTRSGQRWRMLTCGRRGCTRPDHIITDSEFSNIEITRSFGVPKEKVTVIYPGIDHERFSSDNCPADIHAAKRAYGVEGDYLLYLASLAPQKNVEGLIRAYAAAAGANPDIPQLVLGGTGWQRAGLEALVRELNVDNRARFIGYVEDRYVAPLMKGATAFLFPSLYEGFGLPPLEAMACGTPVICSNAASLPEACGDAAILLDPYDTQGWADAMVRVCADDGLRRELGRKGVEQAAGFSWDAALEQVLDVYRKVML